MKHPIYLSIFCASVISLVTACTGIDAIDNLLGRNSNDSSSMSIEVLSNRADLLSGGDAYLKLLTVEGDNLLGLSVDIDGRDVTDAFARRANGEVLGVITGLRTGRNVVHARTRRSGSAQIILTNHPIGGPVFSGPQVQPWICGTVAAGLGEPLDEQCNAPTTYQYQYRSVSGAFLPYTPGNTPMDLATTTTDQGLTVPYIVRLETGTVNRGLYQIAMLFDPTQPWKPWARQPGWNGKLVWGFGGGTAPHHTQDGTPSALDDNALSRGFAVATSGLTVHGSNANDVLSAETIMMVKEHVAETYGPIRYTIGMGCSGGGLQQYIIANSYPGLLDGLMPTCSYPDIWTTAQEVLDCALLHRYFTGDGLPMWLNPLQFSQVEGHSTPTVCQSWDSLLAPVFEAANAANCNIDASKVYDATNNPSGARCTLSDYTIAALGPRDRDSWNPVEQGLGRGFAKRPLSNAGIQYGLGQLLSGNITAAQFVDVNTRIGCLDIDGLKTTSRCEADRGSESLAFRAGLVNDARFLNQVPIIDLRGHDDAEIHTDDWSYVIRSRMDRTHGHHQNQIIFTGAAPVVGDPAFACSEFISAGLGAGTPLVDTPKEACTANPLVLIDEWLAAIETDRSSRTQAQKVIANRPARAVDTCFIAGQAITDEATCRTAYPYYTSPREVAGGPQARDVISCRLKPLSKSDYPQGTFTDAQFAALQKTFPKGVCDWTARDPNEQASLPWLSYAKGPGGQPLPVAPRARGN